MASHFALFVDLENCGGKKSMLMDVIERVKIRGDILIGKVYGYTDSYSDLKEILLSNTFAVVPSLRFGRNQKNSLDIQLVIDALDVAYTNSLIDSFCIVSGDSDYVPLVGKLKTMGKFVLGISRSEAASGVFMNACSEFQFLESVASGKERAQGQEIEALTLSDKVLIINGGRIAQFDTPQGIVHRPADDFVRRFILSQLTIKRDNIYRLFGQPAAEQSLMPAAS